MKPGRRPVPRAPQAPRRPGQDPRVKGAVSGATNARGIGLANVVFTKCLIHEARAEGSSPDDIRDALEQPFKVTDVTPYPGQRRYGGQKGLAVVLDEDTQHAITVYLDGVRTPLRADQMDDPAALGSRRLNCEPSSVGGRL